MFHTIEIYIINIIYLPAAVLDQDRGLLDLPRGPGVGRGDHGAVPQPDGGHVLAAAGALARCDELDAPRGLLAYILYYIISYYIISYYIISYYIMPYYII